MYDIFELNDKSLVELKEIGLKLGLKDVDMPKENLVYSIITKQNAQETPEIAEKPKGRPGRKKKIVEPEAPAMEVKPAEIEKPAETVAENLEEAINSAFIIESPSKRMEPTGEYVAAGIGEGMAGYDFTTDVTSMVTALQTAISAALPGTLKNVGVNAMAGLKEGINAGRFSVITALRSAVQAAVTAAKQALKIASPSKVFRDEIGSMTMKGFGEGILEESKVQAKIVRNAARYLTGEAQEGAIAFGSTDNRKTYNNTSSVNLTGNNFYVRDEQDIRSLAVEIATLTRRQQRGRGLRMA